MSKLGEGGVDRVRLEPGEGGDGVGEAGNKKPQLARELRFQDSLCVPTPCSKPFCIYLVA